VTASALLDLVSEAWLQWIAANCRRVGAAAFFSLTYDGRNVVTPPDPHDDEIFGLFNRHQLTDKGLGGPSVGPRATDVAIRCFQAEGFEVYREPSEWHLGPDQRELQVQLIAGWASAAAETAPDREGLIERWRQRHIANAERGHAVVTVGHWDIFATPPRA
jgi:hypothetical protein